MTCSVKQTIVDRLEIDKLVEHDGTGFRIIGNHNQIKTTLGDFTASLTRSHGIAEPPFSIGSEYVVLNDELLDTIYEIDNGITPPPTEEVVSAEEELLQSVNMILTKLGLTSKSVDKLRDREGNPIKGVAVADILNRSIQYLEGKQEEVPEEVIHFFVQALKELNDPLYISMAERVHKEPEYTEVLTTHSDLGYSEEDLLDEAIAKVILNRILTTLRSPKPGVAELFESNPELAKIGTQEQYSQYLDTIFPDSEVKDIVYHGTNKVFEHPLSDFNFFSTKAIAKGYGKIIMAAIIDLQSPLSIDGGDLSSRELSSLYNMLENEGGDGFIGGNNLFATVETEQIHILGNKQDIEGFKEFVGKPVEATGDRNTRWWGRVKKKLQSVFNSDKSDPFMEAAKEMFQNDLSRYANAISTSKRETMFRSLSAENYQKVVRENVISMNSSMELQAAPRDALGSMPEDAFTILSAKGGVNTIMRYINIVTGKFITWRGTDESALKYAKNRKDVKVSESTTDRSEKMSDYGTNLHAFSRALLLNWAISEKESGKNGKYKDLINIVNTSEGEPEPTLEELWGLLRIDKDSVTSMSNAVKDVLDDMIRTQAAINVQNGTTDKVDLYTEFKVRLDNLDKAGTIDMMFVFSDTSGAIFDYKFTAPKAWGLGALRIDPFRDSLDSFEGQMGFYAEAVKALGVTSLRRTRIIPGALRLKRSADNTKILGIHSVSMGGRADKLLSSIPLLREKADADLKPEFISLNETLSSLNNLLDELSGSRLTPEQSKKKSAIRRTIRELLTRSELQQTIEDMKVLFDSVSPHLDVIDPKDNNYLSTVKINSAMEMIEIFKRIPEAIANTKGYMTAVDKETLAKYVTELSKLGDKLQGLYMQRVRKEYGVDLSAVDNPSGAFHKFVSFRESNSTKISYAAYLIDMANEAANNEYRELYERWLKLDNTLVEWANANGKTVQNAYDMLHRNTKTGKKLVKVFSDSFSEEKTKYLNDYRNGTTTEKTIARNWLQANLEIKEGAAEEYAEALQNRKKVLLAEHGSEANPVYKNKLEYFVKNNDVWTSIDAWGSMSFYKYLQFKPSVTEANYSAEYKELKKGGNEALLAYYEAWQKEMKNLDSMIDGVTIPYNMVANVHAGAVQRWTRGQFGFMDLAVDARLALTLDVANEERSSGSTSRVIPLRYMQPLRNTKGEVDPNLVSAELTPALLEFAMSVLRHKHRKNIEPEVQMVQRILESPGAEEYGMENGTKKLKEVSDETKATMEKMIQMKLYDLGLGGTKNGKRVQASMQLLSRIVMSVPIKSAIGAVSAGFIFGKSQLMSNPNFGEASLTEAIKYIWNNGEKATAIAEYFNIYQEGDLRMHSREMRHNFFTRWVNSDYQFAPLRQADEMGDRRMFVAMLSNFTIDDKGIFTRLEDAPEGSKNALEQIEVTKGEIMTKILPSERTKMSIMFKAEMATVRGSNTPMELAEYQSEIFASAIMQFKGWMPPMILGRYGDVKYDKYMLRMKEGRNSGAWKAFKLKYSPEELEGKVANSLLMASVSEKAYNILASLISDKNYVLTKREREQLKKKGPKYWTDAQETNFLKRRAALQKEINFIKTHSSAPNLVHMNEESFFRMREASVRSSLYEVKAVLTAMLVSLLLSMALDGDDDDEDSYALTMSANLLDRLLLEISMFINPFEILNLNNGVPVLGLLQMFQRIAFTSGDVVFDALSGNEVKFDALGKALLSPLPGYRPVKFLMGK